MKSTPIPDDESRWTRSFSVIHEDNRKALRAILERDAAGDTKGDAYGQSLGDFWAVMHGRGRARARGVKDLEARARQRSTPSATRSRSSASSRTCTPWASARLRSTSTARSTRRTRRHQLAGLGPGRPGPSRPRLLPQGRPALRRTSARRTRSTSRRPSRCSARGRPQAAADAKTVLKLENDLAAASMTPCRAAAIRRRRTTTMTADELKKLSPKLAWDAYLGALGFPSHRGIQRRRAGLPQEGRRHEQERTPGAVEDVPAVAPGGVGLAVPLARSSSTSGSASARR